MIFVTVGTHEQQFNRLIEYIDKLKEEKIIDEDIIIQSGFSTYKIRNCESYELLSFLQMKEYITKARIVITHGGPASFIMVLQEGKIPVVVPRQEKFSEHINNHQMEFVELVAKRNRNIIPVYEIKNIKDIILDYNVIIARMNSKLDSNNERFNKELEKIVYKLMN